MASVVVLLVLVVGCSVGRQQQPRPTSPSSPAPYTQVPDSTLFAEIGELPGVENVDIAFWDDINGRQYLGDVIVAADTPKPTALDLLDRVNAILRQGEPAALIGVMVSTQSPTLTTPVATQQDLGLPKGIEWLTAAEERYGPQPGTGQPPTSPAQ